MKIAAVIAEYNPFHNGHAYHLAQVRAKTNADYIIVAMSGNFMQRGVPALIDKYERAAMALECNADLVLELPCFYACSSAELFAAGSVSLLHELGVVDYLGFGCEDDNLPLLKEIAEILCTEPDEYKAALKNALKEGHSFPVARSIALSSYVKDAQKLLSSPNNILAVEYIKAIKKLSSSIEPVTIKRAGSGYNDTKLSTIHSSALAIRTALFEGQSLDTLKEHVPVQVLRRLKSCEQKTFPVSNADFSYPLHYKLLSEASDGFTQYLDVTADLSDKIKKNLSSYTDFDSFCMLLKSKDMTYSRICRCLLHILLNIKKETFNDLKQEGLTPYARVLGFRKESTALLTEISKHSRIPLITAAADAKSYLGSLTADNACHRELFETDLRAASLYSAAVYHRFQTKLPNEFGAPLFKI